MEQLADFLGGVTTPVEPASTVETPVEAPVEVVAPEPTTTVEQPAERPRDEQGRFARAEPEERPHTVPVQALIEERRKRQEAEQRLQQTQQPPKPIDDEQFWQSPAKATTEVVEQRIGAVQQEIVNMKYQIAEDLTRTLHTDYDSVRDGFIAKVNQGDPWAIAIAQQMGAQANPAKFVYDQARRLAALDQVGDLAGFEARIRAEERAKYLTEQQRPKPAPDVPRSLNSEPSAPSPSTPEAFEPTPLENLVHLKF